MDIRTVVNAENPGRILSNSSVKTVRTVVEHASSSSRTRPGLEYDFTLSSSEGALLILPEGAERHDLRNHHRFLEVATQHGADWYRFAEEKVGQIISNDSLYLITGLYQTTSWSLAAFEKTAGAAEYPAQFRVAQPGGDNVAATYTWDTTRALDWRVGPINNYGFANQTVFIRGFKIALRTRMFGARWISVKADAPSTRPNPARSVGAIPGRSWLGYLFGGPSSRQTIQSSGSNAQDEVATLPALEAARNEIRNSGALAIGEHVVIQRIPEASQAFHPSDIINKYLLDKDPSANIAITHDDDWIAILEENRLQPEYLGQEGRLETLVSRKYDVTSKAGAVYLRSRRKKGTGEFKAPGTDGVIMRRELDREHSDIVIVDAMPAREQESIDLEPLTQRIRNLPLTNWDQSTSSYLRGSQDNKATPRPIVSPHVHGSGPRSSDKAFDKSSSWKTPIPTVPRSSSGPDNLTFSTFSETATKLSSTALSGALSGGTTTKQDVTTTTNAPAPISRQPYKRHNYDNDNNLMSSRHSSARGSSGLLPSSGSWISTAVTDPASPPVTSWTRTSSFQQPTMPSPPPYDALLKSQRPSVSSPTKIAPKKLPQLILPGDPPSGRGKTAPLSPTPLSAPPPVKVDKTGAGTPPVKDDIEPIEQLKAKGFNPKRAHETQDYGLQSASKSLSESTSNCGLAQKGRYGPPVAQEYSITSKEGGAPLQRRSKSGSSKVNGPSERVMGGEFDFEDRDATLTGVQTSQYMKQPNPLKTGMKLTDMTRMLGDSLTANASATEYDGFYRCKWLTDNKPCDREFVSFTDLNTHLHYSHGVQESVQSKQVCLWSTDKGICGKEYHGDMFRSHIWNHLNPLHPCPWCSDTFAVKNSLLTHLSVMHEKRNDSKIPAVRTDSKSDVKDYSFTCPSCDKIFTTKDSLHAHISVKHSKAKVEDSGTGKRSSASRYLTTK